MNTFLMILFTVLCVAVVATLIYMRVSHVGLRSFWAKLGASVLFVTGGMTAIMMKSSTSLFMFFMLLGLYFGMIGDILLELKIIYKPHEKQFTNIGILSFLIGHICYIVGITLYVGNQKDITIATIVAMIVGIILAVLILLNCGNLKVNFGEFKVPAYAYTFMLCITFCYAVALSFLLPSLWILAVGLLLFLVSDMVLSLIYWGGRDNNVLNGINLGLYYSAQILIMIFLFII